MADENEVINKREHDAGEAEANAVGEKAEAKQDQADEAKDHAEALRRETEE